MRWIALPLLAFAACSSAREYRLDKVSDTTALLRITKIVAGPAETRITFRYQAAEESRRIGVHPPGADGAFVITNAEESQTYSLKKVEGVAMLPERTTVGRGEMLEFTLVFESIPASLTQVHVGEGMYSPEAGETSWHFLDIDLK